MQDLIGAVEAYGQVALIYRGVKSHDYSLKPKVGRLRLLKGGDFEPHRERSNERCTCLAFIARVYSQIWMVWQVILLGCDLITTDFCKAAEESGSGFRFAILQRSSARSARQHKAWGVSPRIGIEIMSQPAELATAESPLRVTRLWASTSVARFRGLQTN